MLNFRSIVVDALYFQEPTEFPPTISAYVDHIHMNPYYWVQHSLQRNAASCNQVQLTEVIEILYYDNKEHL